MKKLLSILLMLAIIITAFASCGNKDSAGNSSDEATNSATGSDDSTAKVTQSGEFTIEEIGSIDLDYVKMTDGGLYYQDDSDMYGVMSFDGKADTGAKYEYVDDADKYFVVATDYAEDGNDIAALNCCGLIDANGKEIIPQKYAVIDILNERYAQVCEATASVDNKDEALIYFTSNMFSLTAVEGDLLYSGNWYIYDLTTGEMLDNATGTNNYRISAYGNYVNYYTDDNIEHTVNQKGEELPEGADLFDNGDYALNGAVYDTNSNKLFDYDENSYIPGSSLGDYYLASMYENDHMTYVLMDSTGKTVTSVLDDYPEIYGDLLYVNDTVCDFNGNQIIEGTYKNVYFDEFLGKHLFLRNDESYTLIEKDGTVIYQCSESEDGVSVSYSDFLIKKADENMYYCLDDKDFTIEGSGFDSWLVAHTDYATNNATLTNAINGDVLLDGYKGYDSIRIDNCIYVYAENADGGLDVYTIK